MISIHALREEGDDERNGDFTEAKEFLSTPSARRATRMLLNSALISLFLSTPSARRATITLCHFVFALGISIHALREEGDEAL